MLQSTVLTSLIAAIIGLIFIGVTYYKLIIEEEQGEANKPPVNKGKQK